MTLSEGISTLAAHLGTPRRCKQKYLPNQLRGLASTLRIAQYLLHGGDKHPGPRNYCAEGE